MENSSKSSGTRMKPLMRSFGAVFLGLAFLITVVIIGCKPKAPDPGPDPSPATSLITDSSWVVPIDVPANPTQADYYNFGWQSFVALNWPTDLGTRGKPDMTARIGAVDAHGMPRTTVWQSYKEQFDLFLENGQQPTTWNTPNAGCDLDGNGGTIVLRMFSKNANGMVVEAFNEATSQPLIDIDTNYVRYEVRVAESEYQYFLNTGYFNGNNQKDAVHNDAFVGMPKGPDSLSQSLNVWARFGATEVKAAWRVLPATMPESQRARYFRANAVLMGTNGQCDGEAEVGLVGFHILRLTPNTASTWYWASFEQIDNLVVQKDASGHDINPSFNTNPPQTFPNGYSYAPEPVKPGQPITKQNPVLVSARPFQNVPADLQAINTQWMNALKGTCWEYYMQIGNVNPATTSETAINVTGSVNIPGTSRYWSVEPAIHVNTADMANSTLETYMYNGQPVSQTNLNNCVVCHAGGVPQFYAEDTLKINGNLQVFTFLFGFAQSPPSLK